MWTRPQLDRETKLEMDWWSKYYASLASENSHPPPAEESGCEDNPEDVIYKLFFEFIYISESDSKI